MRIIPAIDIIEGKCVRLSKGDYETKKIYSENPLEMAKQFEDHGIEYLHLVDLDGAKSGHIINHQVLEELASKTNLKIDFGGGVKSDEDLVMAFECGAAQVTAGSVAVRDPERVTTWLENFGAQRIILGADVNQGKIALQGWTETSNLELKPFLQSYIEKGVQSVICTDISKDGMLEGPAISLYQHLLSSFPSISLIASGGVTSIKDLEDLARAGCEGAIVGKAIYEGRISLRELSAFIERTNQ